MPDMRQKEYPSGVGVWCLIMGGTGEEVKGFDSKLKQRKLESIEALTVGVPV